MANTAPWIRQTPIDKKTLAAIYESDKEMYPAPLTRDRLKSWVDACPELSVCFHSRSIDPDTGESLLVGVIVILPLLREYWQDLLVGRLKETDIDAARMFPGKGEADVGLHVFHVERFAYHDQLGARLENFTGLALQSLRDIVEEKGQWNVLGCSGKCLYPEPSLVGCVRNSCLTSGYSSNSHSRGEGGIYTSWL